jgi:hypothetical protein
VAESFQIGDRIKTSRKLAQAQGRNPKTRSSVKGLIPKGTNGQVVGIQVTSNELHVQLDIGGSFSGAVWTIPADAAEHA